MKTFAQNLKALMPEGIMLPSALIEAFDWLEGQGWHHIRNDGAPQDHWLSIYPAEFSGNPATSHVAFGGTNLKYTSHWDTTDPKIDNRIAEIAETSGDGGRAAIWLDDEGKQQFVQIGHDNIGIITDDPVIFLQYLSLGYLEPGALDGTDITPMQSALEYHGLDDVTQFPPEDHPIAPRAFQTYLSQQFGVDIPATARALGIADFPQYHDEATTDPFARWISSITPPPSEADLAYEMELMRTVEALDIKDDDSSEMILGKIGSLFRTKD